MSNKQLGLLVGGGLLLAHVAAYLYNLKDPLDGKTPDVIERLTGAKTVCENRVQELKQAGVDGKARYEQAQVAVNECVGYLKGVLDQGSGDQAEIKRRLERASAACNSFRQWADRKLRPHGGHAEGGGIDLADCVSAVLKLLDGQEQAKREAVKESLDGCTLRSWNDIPAGTGAAK